MVRRHRRRPQHFEADPRGSAGQPRSSWAGGCTVSTRRVRIRVRIRRRIRHGRNRRGRIRRIRIRGRIRHGRNRRARIRHGRIRRIPSHRIRHGRCYVRSSPAPYEVDVPPLAQAAAPSTLRRPPTANKSGKGGHGRNLRNAQNSQGITGRGTPAPLLYDPPADRTGPTPNRPDGALPRRPAPDEAPAHLTESWICQSHIHLAYSLDSLAHTSRSTSTWPARNVPDDPKGNGAPTASPSAQVLGSRTVSPHRHHDPVRAGKASPFDRTSPQRSRCGSASSAGNRHRGVGTTSRSSPPRAQHRPRTERTDDTAPATSHLAVGAVARSGLPRLNA